jgi:spore coat assembly protein
MRQGDLVVRKSYGGDILFRIAFIANRGALLRGTDYRLLADAPLTDLEPVQNPDELDELRKARMHTTESLRRMMRVRERKVALSGVEAGPDKRRQTLFEMPGKVLHLDGDANYLRKSLYVYRQLQVPAEGYHCHESQMPQLLMQLLPRVCPDIVVITGHDGVIRHPHQHPQQLQHLHNYKNSGNFVQAVRIARMYDRHKDSLTVVAGACQSHFEALMNAGANFASSPGRIMIHALDPVYVAVRSAFTPFRETIDMADVIANTVSGIRGVGGIETTGSFRMGVPNLMDHAKNVNIV